MNVKADCTRRAPTVWETSQFSPILRPKRTANSFYFTVCAEKFDTFIYFSYFYRKCFILQSVQKTLIRSFISHIFTENVLFYSLCKKHRHTISKKVYIYTSSKVELGKTPHLEWEKSLPEMYTHRTRYNRTPLMNLGASWIFQLNRISVSGLNL